MNENEIFDSLRNMHDLSKAINSSLRIEEVMEMIYSKTALELLSDDVGKHFDPKLVLVFQPKF